WKRTHRRYRRFPTRSPEGGAASFPSSLYRHPFSVLQFKALARLRIDGAHRGIRSRRGWVADAGGAAIARRAVAILLVEILAPRIVLRLRKQRVRPGPASEIAEAPVIEPAAVPGHVLASQLRDSLVALLK